MVKLLALASGSRGMAGGQAIDLASVGKHADLPELEFMHIHKTGALIRASVLLGACGTRCAEAARAALDDSPSASAWPSRWWTTCSTPKRHRHAGQDAGKDAAAQQADLRQPARRWSARANWRRNCARRARRAGRPSANAPPSGCANFADFMRRADVLT